MEWREMEVDPPFPGSGKRMVAFIELKNNGEEQGGGRFG